MAIDDQLKAQLGGDLIEEINKVVSKHLKTWQASDLEQAAAVALLFSCFSYQIFRLASIFNIDPRTLMDTMNDNWDEANSYLHRH